MTKSGNNSFRHILAVPTMLLHILVIPVFFLGFVLLYRSEWMISFLDMGVSAGRLVFNVLMLMCILLGILCASRIPMTACRKHLHLRWFTYVLWSLAEVVGFSCFAALYMALMYGDYGYFPALGQCMILSVATISYPYILINAIVLAAHPATEAVSEDNLVRFPDYTGRLKLVIARDVILYVEAQENNISVHYTEGEMVKEYTLRQTMKGIEELMDKHAIIRCQRSYYVNPQHVSVLRKDKEGYIYAELDQTGLRPVPVSPKYYDQLSKML